MMRNSRHKLGIESGTLWYRSKDTYQLAGYFYCKASFSKVRLSWKVPRRLSKNMQPSGQTGKASKHTILVEYNNKYKLIIYAR